MCYENASHSGHHCGRCPIDDRGDDGDGYVVEVVAHRVGEYSRLRRRLDAGGDGVCRRNRFDYLH